MQLSLTVSFAASILARKPFRSGGVRACNQEFSAARMKITHWKVWARVAEEHYFGGRKPFSGLVSQCSNACRDATC
jgi:hypothetical protein